MTRTLPLVAIAAALAFAPAAQGQLVAYDGFAYAAGQSLNAQNGGFGFAGPWTVSADSVQIQADSLVPADPSGGLPEAGNSLIVTPASSNPPARATRILNPPIIGTPGTTAWVSIVIAGDGDDRAVRRGRTGRFGPGQSWVQHYVRHDGRRRPAVQSAGKCQLELERRRLGDI
jgi:hypothetical protein